MRETQGTRECQQGPGQAMQAAKQAVLCMLIWGYGSLAKFSARGEVIPTEVSGTFFFLLRRARFIVLLNVCL